MLTILWLVATTSIGYLIDKTWLLESADWVGALIGLGTGIVLKLMVSVGSGHSISGAFDDFGSDCGSSDCGSSDCGGD